MSYFEFGWGSYVTVAEKRRRAQRQIAAFRKKGRSVAPVTIEGRTIVSSFWGKAWCTNLERYSDYASRLPRGRSYVRYGAVVDLRIGKGEVAALVSGSELYKIVIAIEPTARARWQAICRDCAGTIDSLVELLQGRLARSVMDRVCRPGDGLFPAPDEIALSCSCPDWADMCKHVSAVLYGVGARLDEQPQLLFTLRGVDENELLAATGHDLARAPEAAGTAKVLGEGDVAALFGLEMADDAVPGATPAAPEPARPIGKARGRRAAARPAAMAATKEDPPRRARGKRGSPAKSKASARKRVRRRAGTAAPASV